MKTKLTYLFIIAFSFHTFAQSKYAAAQSFKEFAYVKAAELYKEIYDKGDHSKLVLERLGDSYYYNSKVTQSELWYGKLISTYASEVNPEYYFKYAQSLKSNGNYKKSDEMMKKFRSLTSDSRGKALETTPDYVSAYSENPNEIVNLHNLSVNTSYSDFGAFLRGDTFYYASAKPNASSGSKLYKWNNQPYLDLYQATIKKINNSEGQITELTSSTPESTLNTRYHDSNIVITEDGRTMYFTRDNYDGNRKRQSKKDRRTYLNLYKTTLENGKWSKPIKLPFNSDDYSTGHPALSPDQKTLYFVSDRPGTIGQTDIYKVAINGDTYGEVKNLGKNINTEGREMFPFVSKDGVLYFSSDGHLGLGGLDIFESNISGENYSQPKNIAAPFNSKKDDFSFLINEEKNEGFFSSNREGGKGDDDIYSFKISEPKPKPCMQGITGVVTDSKTGEILPNATVKLINADGKVISKEQSNAQGMYNFATIPCSLAYTVLGEKKDYRSDKAAVNTTDVLDAVQKANLALTPLIIGNEIVINPIFFDFNKATIRPDASYELEDVITVMNNNPDMVIKIESHTDSRGSKKYNRNLSDRRAKSTRDYIISRGIASNRIASAIGYGESQLLNNCDDANKNNCTEEQHQRNRRSKFIILSGGANVKVNPTEIAPLNKIDPKPGRR